MRNILLVIVRGPNARAGFQVPHCELRVGCSHRQSTPFTRPGQHIGVGDVAGQSRVGRVPIGLGCDSFFVPFKGFNRHQQHIACAVADDQIFAVGHPAHHGRGGAFPLHFDFVFRHIPKLHRDAVFRAARGDGDALAAGRKR